LNNFDQQEIREQYPEIRNRFMLSEWLIDIPEDFEQWIMIPCPQAPRNLVIAHKVRLLTIERRFRTAVSFETVLIADNEPEKIF
jgi:hypothetical protein